MRLQDTTPFSSSSESSSESATLQTITQELRQLRAEQQQQLEKFESQLRQRDEMIQRMEERMRLNEGTNQLSQFDNITNSTGDREILSRCVTRVEHVGFKIKPDSYDGSAPLHEFLNQFNLIAQANEWSDSIKTVTLASCLRGKARSVLNGVSEIETLKFEEIKSRLELRFGEGHLTQVYYTQFTNRKQKFSEDFATLGADIERLSRLAYPECSEEVRDKIACAQFVAALSERFIKQTLQLENVTSLRSAIQRAMTIKAIQENNFEKGKKVVNFNKNKFSGKFQKKDIENNKKECWQCGAQGHYRSECPTLAEKGNAN